MFVSMLAYPIQPTEVTYSSILRACASLTSLKQGHQSDCKPDKLTFVGVLSGCSNAGLLDKGQTLFKSMMQDYGIEPCIEQYNILVWFGFLEGQAILRKQCNSLVKFHFSLVLWCGEHCLVLASSTIILSGRVCAQRVLEMDPHDDATHILLSNMYATARRLDSVASIRKIMHTKRVRKEPGLSWIEDQGVVHYFTAGNTRHPDIKLISAMLEWLNMKTREEGYVPNIDVVLLDMKDVEKARLLWVHSERLALSFGLIQLPHGCPIHIIKNLRICVDCHIVMKLISQIVQRDIIIRDMNRFYHFQHGTCSCGDYW
ncbi:hypothetical protein K1719_046188 [Acacia pycnantha]|nr:hypothetical protein K1719_046188 [Acacia pycnantha]